MDVSHRLISPFKNAFGDSPLGSDLFIDHRETIRSAAWEQCCCPLQVVHSGDIPMAAPELRYTKVLLVSRSGMVGCVIVLDDWVAAAVSKQLKEQSAKLVPMLLQSPGSLSASGNGFHWRRQDGKVVDVKKGGAARMLLQPRQC